MALTIENASITGDECNLQTQPHATKELCHGQVSAGHNGGTHGESGGSFVPILKLY